MNRFVRSILSGAAAAALLATLCPIHAGAADNPAEGKKMVMVEVPHWKVRFFNLPGELPVLVESGETYDASAGTYDFSAGAEAMGVYLAMAPKDPHAGAFRRFREKWPRYQAFFKAVDAQDYDQAEKLLNEILAIDPKEPAVHFYLGSLNMQAGRYGLAEDHYRHTVERYPEYGPAYIHLARLAMARGSQRDARAYLEQGLKRMDAEAHADAETMAENMLASLAGK